MKNKKRISKLVEITILIIALCYIGIVCFNMYQASKEELPIRNVQLTLKINTIDIETEQLCEGLMYKIQSSDGIIYELSDEIEITATEGIAHYSVNAEGCHFDFYVLTENGAVTAIRTSAPMFVEATCAKRQIVFNIKKI